MNLTFILLFSLSAVAQQAPNDNISKAMDDVSKVNNDPLEAALNAQGGTAQQKLAPPTAGTAPDASSAKLQSIDTLNKPVAAPTKVLPKKKEQPMRLSQEESDLLKVKFKSLKDNPELLREINEDKKQPTPVYVPAPARDKSEDTYVLERDSAKIITKSMSVTDSINLKLCFNAGVQVVFNEDISTTIQTVVIDDQIFFDARPFENNRGVYVRLKQPIPPGMYWESAVRLVRKLDDKSYLVNLIGLPCPDGAYPYPKVVYLKEKYSILDKNAKVLTPQDTIISLSQGLPRVQKNVIRVYDMVASSGSEWVVFGVEVKFPNRKAQDFSKDFSRYFKMLDNLQISEIPTKIEYLPLQSEKATKSYGVPTMRFKMVVNVGKNYIMNNRYLHMMFVDSVESHYQYVKIDTLPYFLSLKKRGFEL